MKIPVGNRYPLLKNAIPLSVSPTKTTSYSRARALCSKALLVGTKVPSEVSGYSRGKIPVFRSSAAA